MCRCGPVNTPSKMYTGLGRAGLEQTPLSSLEEQEGSLL